MKMISKCMTMFATVALVLGLLAPCAEGGKVNNILKIATFDGADTTSYMWRDMNDPVMGGASTSTFIIDTPNKIAIFNGTCAIVPFLNAPGFAKISTMRLPDQTPFPDISSFLAGGLVIRARPGDGTSAAYTGWKIGFSAKDVPRTSKYGGGAFKAPFMLQRGNLDWQLAYVPFNSFSYDTSGYTGRCDTKDPNGQQHVCCDTNPEVCPTAAFLSTLSGLEVWAEGVASDFHLEIDYIGAATGNPAQSWVYESATK